MALDHEELGTAADHPAQMRKPYRQCSRNRKRTRQDVAGSQVMPTLIPMRDSGEFVYGSRIWR